MKILKQKRITIIFLVFSMFFIVFTENAYAAVAYEFCACAERVALNYYDIKSTYMKESSDACMTTCRGNDNGFYIYPAPASLQNGDKGWQGGDTAKYTANCACLTGSNIPMYYPVASLQQAGSQTECNNTCYAKSKDYYYAYDAAGSLSGWKSKVSAPSTSDTSAAVTSGASTSQIQNDSIPGTSVDASSGIVQCGRPGGHMCTLCDLIAGFNRVIQYIMKIAIGVALLAMAIGGVLYVVSAGESAMMEKAKSAITNAAIGFVIVFAAFLIINTTMQYLGTIKSTAGEPTLGITITSWGQFDCTANPNR